MAKKRILIDATHQEEVRIAFIDNKLYDLEIEHPLRPGARVGDIIKGRVKRTVPSINAAFVSIGDGQDGFLPVNACYDYRLKKQEEQQSGDRADGNREALPSIQDVLKPGQEIIVQVKTESRGEKGPKLTAAALRLSGYCSVLMVNDLEGSKVSKNIQEDDHTRLGQLLDEIELEEGMALIIRSAAANIDQETLQRDIALLRTSWQDVLARFETAAGPCLLYREDPIFEILHNHLNRVNEIWINNKELYEKCHKYLEEHFPQHASMVEKVKLYEDAIPIFERYPIEKQIDAVFGRKVDLSSGGSIVIDPTEALIAIDVNSARAEGTDIEETALKVNLEATEAIAVQLKLRDMGGLIVIDFIDMDEADHRKQVEERMQKLLKHDRANVKVQGISELGLMEISRQRLRSSLLDSTTTVCPHCKGDGRISNFQSIVTTILRTLTQESMKRNKEVKTFRVNVPIGIAAFLLNEKRAALNAIEQRFGIPILVIPNVCLTIPEYEVEGLKERTAQVTESHTMISEVMVQKLSLYPGRSAAPGQEMHTGNAHDGRHSTQEGGLLQRWFGWMFANPEKPPNRTDPARVRSSKATSNAKAAGRRAGEQTRRGTPQKNVRNSKTDGSTKSAGRQPASRSSKGSTKTGSDQTKKSSQTAPKGKSAVEKPSTANARTKAPVRTKAKEDSERGNTSARKKTVNNRRNGQKDVQTADSVAAADTREQGAKSQPPAAETKTRAEPAAAAGANASGPGPRKRKAKPQPVTGESTKAQTHDPGNQAAGNTQTTTSGAPAADGRERVTKPKSATGDPQKAKKKDDAHGHATDAAGATSSDTGSTASMPRKQTENPRVVAYESVEARASNDPRTRPPGNEDRP